MFVLSPSSHLNASLSRTVIHKLLEPYPFQTQAALRLLLSPGSLLSLLPEGSGEAWEHWVPPAVGLVSSDS